MRNLVVLNKGNIVPRLQFYPDISPHDFTYVSVFDVVTDSITFAIFCEDTGMVEIQQHMKTGAVHLLATFPYLSSKVLEFVHFVDSSQLVLVFESGEILSVTYDAAAKDPDTAVVEIVGSIDTGITAAAWSPDEETLALLTSQNTVLLLSRAFEPVCEKELNPDDIKISKSKHVSVGWGKTETQFKGKGAKALEREKDALKHAGLDLKEDTGFRDPTVAEIQTGAVSEFDDNAVKISWRGDCEFFSITTKEPVIVEDTGSMYDRRVIRVFNREGELDSVSEPVDGLEHTLSWKPQGSLIASTQRHLDEYRQEVFDVVFYERNGLRHGEFNTRLSPISESIINLEWSSGSEILAFHMHDRVQLWASKNYHWYLKQEMIVNKEDASNKVTFIKFHPEKELRLMIGTSRLGILIVDLAYKTVSGPTQLGIDMGMSLVTDGTTAMITPLALANVPPPVSFREFDASHNINDLAVSKSNELFALLTSADNLHLVKLELGAVKSVKQPVLLNTIDINHIIEDYEEVRQTAFIGDTIVAVLVDGPSSSQIIMFDISDTQPIPLIPFEASTKIVLMKSKADFNALVIELIDGTILEIDHTGTSVEVTKFPQLCRDFELTTTNDNTSICYGISTTGKLFANNVQVAVGVTSIKITESHLLFTTAQHKLCFLHLGADLDSYDYINADSAVDERLRAIEVGSILVSVIPSKYSVVLQAPRGNLETICPRIMVLSGVRKFIKQKNYKQAFLACRTHRIDLDILHDYDPALFLSNIEAFINQINKVEHLDLFVSCLHDEDAALTKYKDTLGETGNVVADTDNHQADQVNDDSIGLRKVIQNKDKNVYAKDSKVNKICAAILEVLCKPEYADKYLQTILTAYACQKPPNLKQALKMIGSFDDKDKLEQAAVHLCFLADVNKLYDTALGLYDVKLSLVLAQQSQKDPKEYLPFLQKLHIQPPKRKEFMIDDHLKNYEKALDWLHELGKEVTEEFDDYVVKHSLYKHALLIYRYDNKRSSDILYMHAQDLRDNKNYKESGLVFESLGYMEDALECYILGKDWKEAISIACTAQFSDSLEDACERLVEALKEEHKYEDAAFIELNLLNNIEAALKLYCRGHNYDMAIMVASRNNRPELVESIIDSQLGEGFGSIAELLADFKGQVNSQLRRLRELRSKKKEDPYGFYGMANEDMDTPDNVSIAASETSTAPSFFTRYTGKTAGTAKTGASRRTAKNRKREERKKAKGRKGTIYEEEYLIRSFGRLIERMNQTQPEATRLIEALIRRNMKEQAYQIQKNWLEVVDFLKENIEEVHKMEQRDRERIDDNGEVYLIDEIPVPKINDFPIKHTLDF